MNLGYLWNYNYEFSLMLIFIIYCTWILLRDKIWANSPSLMLRVSTTTLGYTRDKMAATVPLPRQWSAAEPGQSTRWVLCSHWRQGAPGDCSRSPQTACTAGASHWAPAGSLRMHTHTHTQRTFFHSLWRHHTLLANCDSGSVIFEVWFS